MAEIIKGKTIVSGTARGEVLATGQTISFWGGVDPETGKIVDPRHELFGQDMSGKILVFPYGKGSAAAPLVLLELARQQTAPAGMINLETDPLLAAGPIISSRFYDITIPVIQVSRADFGKLETGMHTVMDGYSGEIKRT